VFVGSSPGFPIRCFSRKSRRKSDFNYDLALVSVVMFQRGMEDAQRCRESGLGRRSIAEALYCLCNAA
jgi:hypothetical protein